MSRNRTSDRELHFYEDTMANLIAMRDAIQIATINTKNVDSLQQIAIIAELVGRVSTRLRAYRQWQLGNGELEPEHEPPSDLDEVERMLHQAIQTLRKAKSPGSENAKAQDEK